MEMLVKIVMVLWAKRGKLFRIQLLFTFEKKVKGPKSDFNS